MAEQATARGNEVDRWGLSGWVEKFEAPDQVSLVFPISA